MQLLIGANGKLAMVKNVTCGMKTWTVKFEGACQKELAKYNKRYRREVASVMSNLQYLHEHLLLGNHLGSCNFGFWGSERDRLYRIGQTGVRDAKETRLYVFPDEATSIIHVLCIGDKNTQPRDIKRAKEMIRWIEERKVTSPGN